MSVGWYWSSSKVSSPEYLQDQLSNKADWNDPRALYTEAQGSLIPEASLPQGRRKGGLCSSPHTATDWLGV